MKNATKYMAVAAATTLFSTTVLGATPALAATKTINWTQTSDVMTTDPSKASDVASSQVISQAGQGLYRLDKSGKAAFADAKSVKVSDDGLTWTFTLRDGLKWSNGEPVTAQDYVYGWQRTVNPANASVNASLMYNVVNAKELNTGASTDFDSLGVKALDDKTFQVSLTNPYPMLPEVATGMAFFPQNKAFVEKEGDKYGTTAEDSLSNGPFVLKGWTGSNKTYSLEKNPEYVDAKKVKPKTVNFQTVTSSATGFNSFKAGDVDYTTLTANQTKQVKNDKTLKQDYRQIKGARTQYLAFNVTEGVLADRDARQAMQYVLNKKQLVNNVMTGSSTTSTTFTPAALVKDPNSGKDFATAFKTSYTKYDTAKAKELWAKALKKAGDKKVTLTLLTDNDDVTKTQAQFVQSQLQKLKGLTVEVKSEPKPARVKAMLGSDFQLVLTGWAGDYADPMSFLGLWKTGATMDFGKWSNKEYDDLLTAASTTHALNAKKRMADLGKADQVYQKEVPAVTLYYAASSVAMNHKVTGVQVNHVGAMFDFTKAVKK
jgi:ABC-type oligopeptide transport system substrate-binding subunit